MQRLRMLPRLPAKHLRTGLKWNPGNGPSLLTSVKRESLSRVQVHVSRMDGAARH